MNWHERLRQTFLHGLSDVKVRLSDLRPLLLYLGFSGRIQCSHHLFDTEGMLKSCQLAEPRRTGNTLSGERGSPVDPELPIGEGRLIYKYEIIFNWSNEDQAFIAEVSELPGCMAHGDSQGSALRNISDAMQFWVDRARALGRPVPEPKGERLMLA